MGWELSIRTALGLVLFCVCLFSASAVNAQVVNDRSEKPDVFDQIDWKNLKLRNKIVPLTNQVYQFLDYCEATGKIDFLPQARPYTKVYILLTLKKIADKYWLTGDEKIALSHYINDLSRESNGFILKEESRKSSRAVLGFAAETYFRTGLGSKGTYATSLTGLPYLTGDLGENITFNAAVGGAFERLAPDLFYQSYTKDGQVNFPNESLGYAFLPYQFTYETLFPHIIREEDWEVVPNVDKHLSLAMIYYTELNGSWYDGNLQISFNNQRRAWGLDEHNLVLSSTARRFPGIELKVSPATWLHYSMLVGSLYHFPSMTANYKKNIYGYDTGILENLFTLHLLEFTPNEWLQVSATASTLWWKRLELSYLMPMVFSHFSQLEVGDYDNNAFSIDATFKIPEVGKTWLSFYSDEMSFTKQGPFFKLPRNRIAWQAGIKSGYVSRLIPGTYATLKYTRLTPFVYTHYPEERINMWNYRPLDMTYSHDGFNLGFYLPPNSGELNLTFVNVKIPDLTLTLDNKLIMHGTNDLASDNQYLNYGDIYRDQSGDIYQYPYLDFTKDGIYDWTVMSDFRFDWKVRAGGKLDYFRVIGSAGFAGTWWTVNDSGVKSPGSRALFSGSLGIVIDM